MKRLQSSVVKPPVDAVTAAQTAAPPSFVAPVAHAVQFDAPAALKEPAGQGVREEERGGQKEPAGQRTGAPEAQ